MSQSEINQSVTDGDSQPALNHSQPQDGESTNREPVGRSSPGKHAHPQKPSTAHVGTGKEPGKAKKRKRPVLKDRNVKSKSDISCPTSECDPSLTQILGPSLDVMLATNTPLPDSASSSDECVPSSVPPVANSPAATSSSASSKTRAGRKPTRLTAVKQQLKLQMEENERLVISMRLLERDIDEKNKLIDKLNKRDSSQKLEIKKLSKSYDSLRHELKYKENDTSVINSTADTRLKCDCVNQKSCISNDLADLKGHVASVAESLLAAVSENGDDTGFVPVKNRRQKPTVVRASTTVSSVSPTDCATSSLPVRPDKDAPQARGSSSSARNQKPPSAPSTTPLQSYVSRTAGTTPPHNAVTPDQPSVAFIGTSLVRGLAHRISKRGFSATSFMYPGCEIPVLRERVPAIFSSNYQPEVIVLQCAGNDVDNGHPVAQVIQQLDSLIHDIKSCCPNADIIINKIPPRGHNNELLETIEIVNKYISDMSGAKGSRVFCSDACPKSYRFFLKDETHFNHKVNSFMPRKCWKY